MRGLYSLDPAVAVRAARVEAVQRTIRDVAPDEGIGGRPTGPSGEQWDIAGCSDSQKISLNRNTTRTACPLANPEIGGSPGSNATPPARSTPSGTVHTAARPVISRLGACTVTCPGRHSTSATGVDN